MVVLAAVGMGVDLRGIVKLGPRPLLVGLALGSIMSVVSHGALYVAGQGHA
ncbi:MAG TPA: hypothetical protein VNG93_02125 [Candidatus Dormibacteraeota bacterium]|nr:hypothetical protein [Candidatus Dormibacteraeota bacterium]